MLVWKRPEFIEQPLAALWLAMQTQRTHVKRFSFTKRRVPVGNECVPVGELKSRP